MREKFEDPIFKHQTSYKIEKMLDLKDEISKIACTKFWISVKVCIQLLAIKKNKDFENLRSIRNDFLNNEKEKETNRYHEAHLTNYQSQNIANALKESPFQSLDEKGLISRNVSEAFLSKDSVSGNENNDKIDGNMQKEEMLIFKNQRWAVLTLNIIFFPFCLFSLISESIYHKFDFSKLFSKIIFFVFHFFVYSIVFCLILIIQQNIMINYFREHPLIMLLLVSPFMVLSILILFLNKDFFDWFTKFFNEKTQFYTFLEQFWHFCNINRSCDWLFFRYHY